MMCMMGARNARGFSSSVATGRLPEVSHLTYEGVFNEIKFDVGKKTDKLLDIHFGYARYQLQQSRNDPSINDYLALFMKSSKDGADRDTTPLNALICLDISGSMAGGLGEHRKTSLSRLKLSVEAIKMFISKLRPNDSIGIITFNNEGHLLMKPTFKSQMNQEIFTILDNLTAQGGTTIRNGFQMAKQMLLDFIKTNQCSNCQNRIIMLTDVGDNSIENEQTFIQMAAVEEGVNVTVVGISNEFRSQVCQKLKNVKGFNYFCAVNEQDIKKYVFETFDFGFFTAAYDVSVTLSSQDVRSIEVFGSPDAEEVPKYNNYFKQQSTCLTITKMKSVFPSQIETHKDTLYTVGGLVLVKIQRKSKQPFFKGKIVLNYSTPQGKFQEQKYEIGFQFHPAEQFYSAECLKSAIEGYSFTSELRWLLSEAKKKKKKQLFNEFWPLMKQLQLITPEVRKKDFESIKKILKEYEKEPEKPHELEQQLDM